MTKRNDIHRPSEINPEDYTFVSFNYYGSKDIGALMSIRENVEIFNAHRAETGGKFSGHEHGGTCMTCGARALYVAIFYHAKSNAYIRVGEICAAKIWTGNSYAFKSWRKKVKVGMKAIAGLNKAKATLEENDLTEAWTIARETPAEDIPEHFNGWSLATLQDMVSKLAKYGTWSDKQFAFARKLVEKFNTAPAPKAPVFAGEYVGDIKARSEFTLTLKFKTGFDTRYGWMNLYSFTDENENTLVWKTSSYLEIEKGETLKAKATVKKHSEYKGVNQTELSRLVVLKDVEVEATATSEEEIVFA